jgi:5-methylcytosine-specific restriction endonuclease McrA
MISLDSLYKRDGGICKISNHHISREEATRDHIRPRAHGGSDDPGNLRLACERCNNRRGSRMPVPYPEVLADSVDGYALCAGVALEGRRPRSVL